MRVTHSKSRGVSVRHARVHISPISPIEGFRRLIIDFRVHASRFVEAHNINQAPYLACRSMCKRPVWPLRAYTRRRVEPRAKRRRSLHGSRLTKEIASSRSLSALRVPSYYFHSNCRAVPTLTVTSTLRIFGSMIERSSCRIFLASCLSARFPEKVITFNI